jgi:hypothetical protein
MIGKGKNEGGCKYGPNKVLAANQRLVLHSKINLKREGRIQ